MLRLVYKERMPRVTKVNFDRFCRMMAKAVRIGRIDYKKLKPLKTPLELAVALKVPGAEARSVHILYLREAYLAGRTFRD